METQTRDREYPWVYMPYVECMGTIADAHAQFSGENAAQYLATICPLLRPALTAEAQQATDLTWLMQRHTARQS